MHLGQATPSLEHPARDTFPVLVKQLARVYEHAQAHQQATTERQLTELILGGLTSHILNPAVVVGKGRPKGAKNRNPALTQRDPSGFELVPGGAAAPTRRCSCCKQLARHNARSCPLRPPSFTPAQ